MNPDQNASLLMLIADLRIQIEMLGRENNQLKQTTAAVQDTVTGKDIDMPAMRDLSRK